MVTTLKIIISHVHSYIVMHTEVCYAYKLIDYWQSPVNFGLVFCIYISSEGAVNEL